MCTMKPERRVRPGADEMSLYLKPKLLNNDKLKNSRKKIEKYSQMKTLHIKTCVNKESNT